MLLSEILIERKGRFFPNDINLINKERIEKIDFTGNIFLSNKKSKTNMILVKPGDLVISGINVSKGAISIYNGDKDVFATIHYSSYSLNINKIDRNYFYTLIKTKKFLNIIKDQIKGGIKTEIKPKLFLSLNFDFPNIEDQQKISSKIISISNKTKKIENEILNQKENLVMLRKSLLYDIFEGRDSYLANLSNLKSISLTNDFKLILDKKINLKKKKKLKKFYPLIEIKKTEKITENNSNLIWCRISDLFLLDKGFIGIKKAVKGPYPLVTTALERSSHNEHQFNGEAILVPLVSSTGHGHASINRLNYQSGKFAVGSILCALSPIDTSLISTKFYYNYLSLFKDQLIVSQMKGSANVSLTLDRLANIIIPYIPFKLQIKFENIFNKTQEILTNTENNLTLKNDFEKTTYEELMF